jgi:DNA-binding MarR family transcriptional regulator
VSIDFSDGTSFSGTACTHTKLQAELMGAGSELLESSDDMGAHSRHLSATAMTVGNRCYIFKFVYSYTSLYDVPVTIKPSLAYPNSLLESLADFRFELRKFLHFSEAAATAAGLQPQQHQLLLQVAGAREGTPVTIAYAARRLKLRHNSVVQLVDRSVNEGFLLRAEDVDDLRRVLLQITPKGKKTLRKLSIDHARELTILGPRLTLDLQRISAYAVSKADDR